MTRSLIIQPGGSCERRETPANETARLVIGNELEVVTVRYPVFAHWNYVMYIDDFGAIKELPLNVKAWALYGGSPIFGVAVLGEGDYTVLLDDYLQLIESDYFPDPLTLAQMRDFIKGEN